MADSCRPPPAEPTVPPAAAGSGTATTSEEAAAAAAVPAAARRNPFRLGTWSREKHTYMQHFDAERWLHLLGPFSFASFSRPLSVEEARMLIKRYRMTALKVHDDPLTAADEAVLTRLRRDIDELLALHFGPGGAAAAFFRLSSRSPKDATLDPEHPRLLSQLCDGLRRRGGAAATPNAQMCALLEASQRLLCASSADDILWLLGHSERTTTDLRHSLEHLDSGWDVRLIFREWSDALALHKEFRGFVCGGRLCAVSQYNDMCHYPELHGLARDIGRTLGDCCSRLLAAVPELAAVPSIIDFCYLGPDRAVVIEINPFGPTAGASLFHWQTDRVVLQGGIDYWGDLDEYRRSRRDADSSSAADVADADADIASPESGVETIRCDNGVVVRMRSVPSPRVSDEFVEGWPILTQAKQLLAAEEAAATAASSSSSSTTTSAGGCLVS